MSEVTPTIATSRTAATTSQPDTQPSGHTAHPPGSPTSAPQPQPVTRPQPDTAADVLQATATISPVVVYLWPTQFPRRLIVDADQSSATVDGFVLTLVDQAGGQWYATVRGGDDYAVREPPYGAEPIPIRGQDGFVFTTGAGYSLFWQEAGSPCQVAGGLTLEDALLLAESLEAVDLETWQQRLDDDRMQT